MSWRGKHDPWADTDTHAVWLEDVDRLLAEGVDAFTAVTTTDPRNAVQASLGRD